MGTFWMLVWSDTFMLPLGSTPLTLNGLQKYNLNFDFSNEWGLNYFQDNAFPFNSLDLSIALVWLAERKR
jgi:hypothetical protein